MDVDQNYPHAAPIGVPVFDIDFYSDDVILDPYPQYAAMRALGPVVYLPQLGNYAITRYAEVREALRNWQVFSSAEGIMGDKESCEFFRGASNIVNDPPFHDVIRAAMAPPLMPNALGDIRARVVEAATGLIERLVKKQSFDGMADLARYLPLTLVTELVGLPEDGRENMLHWAAAAFDITGIQNERGRQGLEILSEMRNWITTQATPDQLRPGSLTARIRDMVGRGEVPEDQFLGIMNDYITPSLDTTISATGELIYRLGQNQDQWALLQRDPSLIANAVNEAVRIGAPIRSFTRTLTTDYVLGGVSLPAGARVMVLYASANRDERKFPDADRFDITRSNRDHVGFGHGVHMCLGMHLAKLEMEALLSALIRQVDRIEVGKPTIALNNTIRAFATLPVTLYGRAEALEIESVHVQSTAVAQRWISVRVAARRNEAEGVVSLELVAADGGALPPYEAGSHIDVEIDEGLVRQYSLSGDPATKTGYRIGVLREVDSRGGSVAVHERLHQGASLRIGAPKNFFHLDEIAPSTLLFAGGIGVTPILAMAYRLHGIGASFSLHYAVRSRTRAAFTEELAKAAFHGQVNLHFDDEAPEQRLDVKRILESSATGTHLYCCGPAGFMNYVTQTAEALGWPKSQIHVEHFAASPVLVGAPFSVVAQRSGRTFDIPCERTILDVLADAGYDISSSCRSGVCGTCMTPVIHGLPDHRDMVQTEEEKAENLQIAICCSRSKTRQLVLDI
jgi:cytochrome P450/ferredoxin-NADP reductase